MFTVDTATSATVLRFHQPMRCISTAMLGGGVREIDTVINHTLDPVTEFVDVSEMAGLCRKIAMTHRADLDRTCVLLTSVPQHFAGWSSERMCVVTAGLGNACALEPNEVWDEAADTFVYDPGTVNCILVLSEMLCEEALIEAYGIAKVSLATTVAEWSRGALGEAYPGTQTDCLSVLVPAGKPKHRFASLGTKVGAMLAKEAREALTEALLLRYPELETEAHKQYKG